MMDVSEEKSTSIDLTKCSICLETLKDHLPCLHSFCEGCIKTYIRKRIGHTKGGFNCPSCRTFVSKPDDISVEEFTSRLPINPILVSLFDNYDSTSQKICAACARENESESASSWCINCGEPLCKLCERYHRRSKLSSNHKLVDIESLDHTEFHLNRVDSACTEHPEKKAEAYCSDHSAVCCMTCVLLKHRKCENVGSVEDAAVQKKKSIESETFHTELTKIKKSLETMVQDRTDNLQTFDKDIQSVKSEVGTLFTQLSIHLNRLRTDILMEISRIENEIRPEIQDKGDEIRCKISAAMNNIALFETNIKSSPPAQFLQTMEQLLEQKLILEKFVNDESQKLKEISVTFNASEKLLEITKGVKAFGKVNLSRGREDEWWQSFGRNTSMRTESPYPSSVVQITGGVTGIAITDNGQVVLSNSSNRTIELRDSQCSIVLSRIQLTDRPWGIKMTSDTEGVVAVDNEVLILIKIHNNRLTRMSPTDVTSDFVRNRGKYNVAHGKDINVYDSNNRIFRALSTIDNVFYVAARPDHSCCYTCTTGNELFCINVYGTPLFTYSHPKLRGTTGVTVDQSGFIYVCGRYSRNIHQLNHDGRLNSIILDNLPAQPYCISFNKNGNRAVVGCNDTVLLFDWNNVRKHDFMSNIIRAH